MNILGINGSPRRHGNTSTLMKSMLEGAQHAGAQTELIELSSFRIEGCIGCEQCRRDKTCTRFYDGMHLLYPKIMEADGLILGSPTYNYNMTPQMKAFIDRLYPYFDFTEPRPGPYSSRLAGLGKRSLVFAVCEQHDPGEIGYTLVAMRDAIRVLGYEIAGEEIFSSHFHARSAAGCTEDLNRAVKAGASLVKSF
jgi:multimeric flavodoxin WrbA